MWTPPIHVSCRLHTMPMTPEMDAVQHEIGLHPWLQLAGAEIDQPLDAGRHSTHLLFATSLPGTFLDWADQLRLFCKSNILCDVVYLGTKSNLRIFGILLIYKDDVSFAGITDIIVLVLRNIPC